MKKRCIMTAYADETLALLKVLGQDINGSVDWNSRLKFEGVDGDKEWVVMQSGIGKVRARDEIAKESGAVAVNWESAAIVDVCAINNVKYVGIRIISDLCVEEDSGPIPEERIKRLNKSTTAYVETLMNFI